MANVEKKETLKIALSAAIAIGILGGSWFVLQNYLPRTGGSGVSDPLKYNSIADRVSYGEKILVTEEGNENPAFVTLKKDGTQAIAKQDYNDAISQLETAMRQKRNAPETLIYLNNARIARDGAKAYTIAVPLPIGSNQDRTLEILRGFAQAQDEINLAGGINGTKLKLQLIDDNDDPQIAKEIAENLVNDKNILGVMGGNRSEVIETVTPIYNDSNLVFITPISVISDTTDSTKPYFFRTNTINTINGGRALADYTVNIGKSQKVAIYYSSKLKYSKDLKTEFSKNVVSQGGEVVAEFDFSQTNLNVQQSIEQATAKGAEVLMLVPNLASLNKTWELLRIKNEQFPKLKVIGDIANLYRIETLREGREAAVGMVLAVPWHIGESDASGFSKRSEQLWGASVNWATAMSYDAAQAFIEAIKHDPSRSGIQKALSSSDFAANGTSGRIKFFDGDPKEKVTLVEVRKMPSPALSRSRTGYDFVPLQ